MRGESGGRPRRFCSGVCEGWERPVENQGGAFARLFGGRDPRSIVAV